MTANTPKSIQWDTGSEARSFLNKKKTCAAAAAKRAKKPRVDRPTMLFMGIPQFLEKSNADPDAGQDERDKDQEVPRIDDRL